MTDEGSFLQSKFWADDLEIISVKEEDFPPVLDVLETAFPELSRTFFHSITVGDPAYRPAWNLAIREGKRLLAFLHIYDRSALIDGNIVRFGGIGSVGTRPECRGHGYASALLNRATEIMFQNGMIGSFLYTTIHPFYERVGWKRIRQSEMEIAAARLSSQTSYRPDWARGIRDNDYPQLHSLYAQMQIRLRGGVLRTEEYWKKRNAWLTHFPVIVMKENEILGYFYYAKFDLHKPVMTVTEFGYTHNEPWIFDRLLRVMARKAEEIQCSVIRGFFEQDSDFSNYCRTENLVIGIQDFHYLMWKDLSEQPLLHRLRRHAESPHLISWTTDAF